MTVAQIANLVSSGAVAVSAAVFAATYQLRAPGWRLSTTGRHVMAMSVAIGLLGLYSILAAVWPHGCIADLLRWARTGVVAAIALLLIQRTRMVIQAQRRT